MRASTFGMIVILAELIILAQLRSLEANEKAFDQEQKARMALLDARDAAHAEAMKEIARDIAAQQEEVALGTTP